MGVSICNYNKNNQNIPTSYTNLAIIDENNKTNKRHTYKYYSNLKTYKKKINNISQLKDRTNHLNVININKYNNKHGIRAKNVNNSNDNKNI